MLRINAETTDREQKMIKWYSPPHKLKIKGYALVTHGLNLNPEKMEAIIDILTLASIKVLLLSLSGHGGNYISSEGKSAADSRIETLKRVNCDIWKNETVTAYQHVKTAAETNRLPIFFIGYSLGGLLGCELLVSNDQAQFDKMVLFAPALNLGVIGFFLKLLSPFSGMVIPSAAPEAYRTNRGTPLAAYLAMLNVVISFKKTINPRLNVPTLVLIDKQDELVSYNGLKKLITNMQLGRWQLHRIRKDESANRILNHHLIIDADSTGAKTWEKLKNRLIEHLKCER